MTKMQQTFDMQTHLDRFLIGESEAIKTLKKEIKLVAPTEAQVLISGETGTGKNLVAQMIHDLHPQRKNAQFRRTNIGALVPELAASQLFGHAKGAFTGAERHHEGIIVEADRGTLFLDEISKASPNVQVMLLTLLEVDRINPVGGSKQLTRKVDIRILSATSLSSRQLLKLDSFRQELFFRLAEYIIEVPPLRERREDICLLAHAFMHTANKTIRIAGDDSFTPLLKIDDRAKKKLCYEYDWPGNVRELKHVIRAAAVRSREYSPKNTILHADWIEFPNYAGDEEEKRWELELDGKIGLREHVARFCHQACLQALQKTGGNKTKAARELLKIDFATLQKHLNYQAPEDQ